MDRKHRRGQSHALRPIHTVPAGDASHGHSRRSHTARFCSGEVSIHYRFHPRAGSRTQLVRRHSYRGQAILVVRHPDGIINHLPEWMAQPQAAELGVREQPRFPLQLLSDLRDLIGGFLLAPTESAAGEHNETIRTMETETGNPVRTGQASSSNDDPGSIAATPGNAHSGSYSIPADGEKTDRRQR